MLTHDSDGDGERRPAQRPATTPRASVVVPTHNRPQTLRRCVQALLAQTAADLEIIVIDDGGTTPAAQTLAGLTDPRLRVERQANAGPAAARNRGAALARSAWLAFVDDDCAPRPDWLERLLSHAGDRPRDMVGGVTRNALPRNAFAEASQQLVDYLYVRLNADAGDALFLTSNNMLVPAEGYRAVGGFDEGFRLAAGEDRHFCRRWRDAGRAISVEPRAVVDHYHAMGLRRFWRQHVAYGRGAYRFYDLQSRDPQRSEEDVPGRRQKAATALEIARWPLGRARGLGVVRGTVLSGLLVLSQVATAAGYAGERRQSRRDAGAGRLARAAAHRKAERGTA